MSNINLFDQKKEIVNMSYKSEEGHIASAFSVLDIIWVLYDKFLGGTNCKNDFILSKGHASLALYVVLKERGLISQFDLDNFASYNSILGGHPDRKKIVGVLASTGSLGHGFPIAVGIALGKAAKKESSRTFVLVGDGELNEGSMWESIMIAGHHRLSDLVCIVDYNHSTDRALDIANVEYKFKAFNWNAISVNGHDHSELEKALSECYLGKPLAIIAHTIKGKGCSIMENNPAWHHKCPNESELAIIMEDLK